MLQGLRARRHMLLVVTFVMVSVCYAITTPYLQSPDEAAHVDLVRAMEEREGWPEVRGRRISNELSASRVLLSWKKNAYPRAAADATGRQDRPTFEELETGGNPGAVNHITQHPPMYYVVIAGAAGLTGAPAFAFADATADRVAGWYRFIDAVLVGAAVLAAVVAVRLGGGGPSAQLLAGVLMLAVPQLTYLAGSVNNDNGLVIVFGLLTPIVLLVASGRAGRRLALLGGVLAGTAPLVKIFGAAAVVWLATAYIVAWWGRRSDRRRVLGDAVVAVSVAAVAGGSWWVRNLVLYGRVQPAGMRRDVAPLPGFDHGVDDWIRGYVPRMLRSFFGNFGYLDTSIPLWVVLMATCVFGVVLLAAVIRAVRSRAWERMVLLVPLGVLMSAVALHNYVVVFDNLGGRFAAAQGRYWFGAVVPTVVFVALGLRDLRWAPAVGAVAAVLLQVTGFVVLVGAYYGGATPAGRVESVLAWSPWPVWMSVSAFLATGALMLRVVFVAIGAAREPEVSEEFSDASVREGDTAP